MGEEKRVNQGVFDEDIGGGAKKAAGCTKEEKVKRERCQTEDADALIRDAKECRRMG